jgi:Putative zinc-finger
MKKPDHETFREWLQLEAEGDLAPELRERLEGHLAQCPECQAEQRDLAHLHRVLVRGRLPVRTDFRESVLAALPAAGWESRHPRTWRFPVAVAVLFGVLAATCFGLVGGSGAGRSPVWGAVSALGGFFRATLVAGAGLVHASWKGWGMVFGEIFNSWATLGAFAVLVLCLNLLLVSLVRRRPSREFALRGGGTPRR